MCYFLDPDDKWCINRGGHVDPEDNACGDFEDATTTNDDGCVCRCDDDTI